MEHAERVAAIARDPGRMREIAAETLSRTADRLATAALSDDDRAHCLHLLATGTDALLLSDADAGAHTNAHVLLIGAAFGACIAVADVIEGYDRTGPQADLHGAMRETGEALRERNRYAH